MRGVWFPTIVAGVAIAVGVGSYTLASPFAAPTHVKARFVDGWMVAEATALRPLVEPLAESALEELAVSPAIIPVADPALPESVRALLVDHLALVDALALSRPLPSVGSAVKVFDECATDDAPSSDCPTGTRASVLASVRVPDLAISASLSRALCTDLVNSSSQVGIAVASTVPITLTATYEVDGAERRTVLVSEPDARAAWAKTGEAGAWEPIIHCLQLSDLPNGWLGTVRLVASSDAGRSAQVNQYVQTGGEAVVPPFRVDTIGNSTIVISIPTVDVSALLFSAIAVPFGEAAVGCSFAGTASTGWIEPAAVVEERFTPAQLTAQSFVPTYVERHSAAFIVPEASTITVCAGWSDSHAWGLGFPDHSYGEVLHSPDLVMPRVTVDSIGLWARGSGGDVQLTGSIGAIGAPCGRLVGLEYRALGEVLCDYSVRPVSAGWDGALIVTATATALGSTGTRTYQLPVAPRVCGYGCDIPKAQFFDIPLHTRSQPCIGKCSDYSAGMVRLRVDWIDAADSWASGWIREQYADALPRNPQFDISATVELASLDLATETQSAEVVLTTDRETKVEVVVTRWSETGPFEVVRTLVEEEFVDSRTIRIDNLPAARRTYFLTLTFTDRYGNMSAYSPLGGDAIVWGGGSFVTDRVPIALEAELTVRTQDGSPVGIGNHWVEVGATSWSSTADANCSPGELVASLGDPDRTGGFGIDDRVAVSVVLFEPADPASGSGDCTDTEMIPRWRNQAQYLDVSTPLDLDDLRRGVTVTFIEDGYIIELRLTPTD